LKRYRQSVLKSACEGRLVPTEAELARAEGREYELGEVLLERILEKHNKRKKYKEPAAVDTTKLPVLPEGWIWTRTGDICEGVVPGRTKPKEFRGEIPWITLPDVSGLYISKSLKNLAVTKEDAEMVGMKVMHKGTVLMSCVGQFGIVCIANFPIVPNQQFHGFVCYDDIIPNYVAYSLMTQIEQMKRLSTATTIAYMNKTKCNSILISLPPLAEQHRIVTEVERRISVADEMEKTIEQSLKQAERLRQSILKRAFEGKLVPQDPEDEPAGVLLERIKAEKAQREKVKVKRKIKHTME
jgi:type I restriction enzyme S subunit